MTIFLVVSRSSSSEPVARRAYRRCSRRANGVRFSVPCSSASSASAPGSWRCARRRGARAAGRDRAGSPSASARRRRRGVGEFDVFADVARREAGGDRRAAGAAAASDPRRERREVERRRQVVRRGEPAARLGAMADARGGCWRRTRSGWRASPGRGAARRPARNRRRRPAGCRRRRRRACACRRCASPSAASVSAAARTRPRAAPRRSAAAAPRRSRRSGRIRPLRPAESSRVAQSRNPVVDVAARAWLKVGGHGHGDAKRKKTTGRKNGTRKSGGAPLAAIVLAAGKGTRMRSSRAKVLHELLGRRWSRYPVELARALGADPVVAVLGHQHEAVEAVLLARFGAGAVTVVEQTEQRGTGHAVRLAMPALARFDGGRDGAGALRRRSAAAPRDAGGAGRARRAATAAWRWSPRRRPIATGYGRILRDQRGHVIGVVEQKDASPEEQAINEINAGIYCGPADFFREATLGLGTRNAQGEYYLTDVVARAAAQHRRLGDRGRLRATSPASTIASSWPRPRLTLRGRINRALAGARHLPRSRLDGRRARRRHRRRRRSWGATSRCADARRSATARASATASS